MCLTYDNVLIVIFRKCPMILFYGLMFLINFFKKMNKKSPLYTGFYYGVRGGIRILDTRLRRAVLYPAELQRVVKLTTGRG